MTTWRRVSQQGTDQDVMRCVIDESGSLIFASPAVGWALGLDLATLHFQPANTIMDIVSKEGDSSRSFNMKALTSGFYEVALLRQRRDPMLVQARIDRIDLPDGRKCTVIWLDPDGRLRRTKDEDANKAAHDFAHFIVDTQKKTEDTPKADLTDISNILTEDSELRHFLNLTSDILGVYRRNGSFLRVNSAFNRALGYSDAELRLFPYLDLITPEDRGHAFAAMQKMLQVPAQQEMRIDFESRVRCKDGTIRWMEWTHKAVGDCIYIVGRDITALKQHEAELIWREQQLSEAQKIGRMGHWYWEVNQTYMEVSDQIYEIFGVEKTSFSPTINNVNTLLVRRDLSRVYKVFQSALVRKNDYNFEFRLRRPNGDIRFIRCEGRCKLSARTGEVEALFGIMQDITERKLHEHALREAKESAESAYSSRTRFLANMSHELRTPLNAIIGFSEMMQRQLLGPVGNARYLDYIGGIRESGEHLLDLINDILDMSKIEVGKYELHAEEINVGKLIRLAIHMIEGRAQESGIRLITDCIPDDVHVTADRRALMQILLNVLSNAVKFTNSGGSIEISCAMHGEDIGISVIDTGIGIPEDKIATVTLPFEQLGSEFTRKHEGTGLGLAITKDLIEMHGGRLSISSKVGKGTTVCVSLPKTPAGKNVRIVPCASEDAA